MARALPEVTPENEFFWKAGAEGVLRLQRCQACGALRFPPGPCCPRCQSTAHDIVDTTGRGRVVAATTNHQTWPGAPSPPYALAIIELLDDPAVRLTLRVDGVGANPVEIGTLVEIGFEPAEDVWIPFARIMPEAA